MPCRNAMMLYVRSLLCVLYLLSMVSTCSAQVYASYEHEEPQYNGGAHSSNKGGRHGNANEYNSYDYDAVPPQYNYDYAETYNYEDGGGHETGPIARRVHCYACHYSKTVKYEQGMGNCMDPFIEEGIPLVECEGFCAKTTTLMGDGEFMLVRSCLPNCKNLRGELARVECCAGSKCNGAKLSTACNNRCHSLITIVIAVITCWILTRHTR